MLARIECGVLTSWPVHAASAAAPAMTVRAVSWSHLISAAASSPYRRADKTVERVHGVASLAHAPAIPRQPSVAQPPTSEKIRTRGLPQARS
jgi:hypothetical protein